MHAQKNVSGDEERAKVFLIANQSRRCVRPSLL